MKLATTTSGFALSATITVLFSTALACVKDVNDVLKDAMKSLTGHDWTTQGLVDLVLFAALGLIFMNTAAVQKMDPGRLTVVLIGAVVISSLGLALWYSLVCEAIAAAIRAAALH